MFWNIFFVTNGCTIHCMSCASPHKIPARDVPQQWAAFLLWHSSTRKLIKLWGTAMEKAIAKEKPFVQWYSHPLPKDQALGWSQHFSDRWWVSFHQSRSCPIPSQGWNFLRVKSTKTLLAWDFAVIETILIVAKVEIPGISMEFRSLIWYWKEVEMEINRVFFSVASKSTHLFGANSWSQENSELRFGTWRFGWNTS